VPVREKLGTAVIVVALVLAWGVGFLWFKGDLHLPGGKDTPTKSSAAQGPSKAPPVTKQTPAASTAYAGKVTRAQEHAPVEINPEPKRPAPVALPPVAEWRMATFNLLGASHTGGHGKDPGRSSGSARMGGAIELMRRHEVSVVGFQEMQGSQRAAFRSRAPGWQLFPGDSLGNSGENSIGWDTNVWDLVKPQAIAIPYFNGRARQMPYILLRNKATGVQAYFANFHNPADIRQFRHQQRFRSEAKRREILLFNNLQRSEIPVFVTGDMNEREEFFCQVVGATSLKAAAGGSVTNGNCQPPRPTQIDWILGSPDVVFDGYNIDRSALVAHTTDHPVVSTHVVVDSLKFKNSYAPAVPTP
jgi:hypothetical protein